MKKEKILLFIIILLIILVVCIIGILLNINSENKQILLNEDEGIIDMQTSEVVTEVTSRNHFYAVQNAIESFYTCYTEIFKDVSEGYLTAEGEEISENETIQRNRIEKVYKILDEEYLKFKGITLENLSSKLPKVHDISINIQNMYYIEKDKRISAYFVYGIQKDTLNSQTTDFSIMVKLDSRNQTYKVLLSDYIEKNYKDLKIGDRIEISNKEIPEEQCNKYTYKHISDEEYINDLIINYKRKLRENRKETYSILEENYKTLCFKNEKDYVSYIDEHFSKIITLKLDTYNKKKMNGHMRYIFKDTKGNYYIFNETAPFQYTVMLDNYTIPTEEFIETYNQKNEAEKVVLNIKRFFMGIDDQNYGFSYSVLSEAFKGNKYPTKEEFIKYAKQNFFEENEIKYEKYEKENGVYIYKIKITDATGKSSEERVFNMIIRLKSGTDFEMSFSAG